MNFFRFEAVFLLIFKKQSEKQVKKQLFSLLYKKKEL